MLETLYVKQNKNWKFYILEILCVKQIKKWRLYVKFKYNGDSTWNATKMEILCNNGIMEILYCQM